MKAAVLKAFGSKLAIETVPAPVLGTGEVIVDVMASRVLAYANEVLSGERKYLMEMPMVPGPGAIGRVRSTGPDATHLAVGDFVYCDPTVRSRDDARAPDIILQGLTSGSESALRLQRHFHDGLLSNGEMNPAADCLLKALLRDSHFIRAHGQGKYRIPAGFTGDRGAHGLRFQIVDRHCRAGNHGAGRVRHSS